MRNVAATVLLTMDVLFDKLARAMLNILESDLVYTFALFILGLIFGFVLGVEIGRDA